MVIVAGQFRVDPAQRDAFLEGRRAAMERSRGEDGCIEYVFAPDPLEADRVVLYERWASKEALRAHLQVNASTPPDPDAPKVDVREAEVRQYEISAEGAVGS